MREMDEIVSEVRRVLTGEAAFAAGRAVEDIERRAGELPRTEP